MSDSVNWRSAYREAWTGVTKDTTWEEVVTIPGLIKDAFTVQDCFYVTRETSSDVFEICRISLQGDISILMKNIRGGPGLMISKRGKLFWFRNGSCIPVGHSETWCSEPRTTELRTWNSTPGRWLKSGQTVYRPDGTEEVCQGELIGIHCNKPVPRFAGFGQRIVGPYHVIFLDGVWCRNLLKSGFSSPEKYFSEQFFPLPGINAEELVWSDGCLYVLHRDRISGQYTLKRSFVPN